MITPEIVDKVLEQIQKRYSNYEYFFEKLTSPDWIPFLLERNIFKQPPNVVREQGYISFPFWPESDYLARMAPYNPSLVSKTIMSIPINDNLRIHGDFINAALAMPIEEGFPILKRETKWMQVQPYIYFLLPEKAGKAIIYLAQNGRSRLALELAASVLDITAKENRTGGDNGISIKMELHSYENILKNVLPELVLAAPKEILFFLCTLLERAVEIKIASGKDLSCFWHTTVEDHPQNKGRDVINYLVTAVRDVIEKVANSTQDVEEVISILRKRNGTIFERIALHILRVRFVLAKTLAVEAILTEELFRDAVVKHEYSLLLRERFKELKRTEQEVILGWIMAGPQYTESSPNLDRDNAWRRNHLSLICEDLPVDWQGKYNELIKKYGSAHHPEFSVYTETRMGFSSCLEIDEASKMPITDLIKYVATWEPEEGWGKPTREGLGMVLLGVVKARPTEIAEEALSFRGVDPTYVSYVILGLTQALNDKKIFNWFPVLNLCKWIVNEPVEVPGRISEYGDMDKGWTWTRRNIASLLRTGFQEGETRIPFQLRNLCWDILNQLVEDTEPTSEMEERFLSSRSDPLDFAIGTTRGEALIATIEYAIWVKRFFEEITEVDQWSIESVREVREILERHLDIREDSSLAIRSIYGYCFVRLLTIDKQWVKGIVTKIFPSDPLWIKYRWCAWESYILSWNVYSEVYEILKEEYQWAVSNLFQAQTTDGRDRVLEKVTEHLMVLYGWGVISLTSDDGLIENFFKQASDVQRASAIETVGRWLRDNRDVPPEVCINFQNLWEWRKQYQNVEPEIHKTEIMSFGWLFIIYPMDITWSLNELIRSLKLVGIVEPSWLVVEHLDTDGRISVNQAVECLDLLMRGLKQRWAVHHVEEHAKNIIGKALNDDEPIRNKAQALIDYLSALGYREYAKISR